MPWVRIDEEFPHHPKVAQVGPFGVAVQVAALCYSNRYLTDGFIPFGAVRTLLDFNRLGENIGDKTELWVELGAMNIAMRLVEAGMWEEVDGGFLIHDFHIYQPSRAEVEAERKKTRDRVAKHRERKTKGGNTPANPSSNGGRNAVTNPVSTPLPVPGPVPLPSPLVTDVLSFTGVGDMPVDEPVDKQKGKGRKEPRTKRHPSDEYVTGRARQIQAESGPDAARAYRRKVAENYGQMAQAEQLRRLEEIAAQDAAAEAAPTAHANLDDVIYDDDRPVHDVGTQGGRL